MEEWNAETIRMIENLHHMKNIQRSCPLDESRKDKYGFSFEPADSFSTDPLGFVETAAKLEIETTETFRIARVAGRHSPLFYETASLMEKLLSRMGSACITYAILQQQGESAGILDDMSIGYLREMTAFLFRKCNSSCMESFAYSVFNPKALDLSIRFAALDKRLQATDEKIGLIREGKLTVSLNTKTRTPEKRLETAGGQPEQAEEKAAVPFAPKANALPADRSVLRGASEETADPLPETDPEEAPLSGSVSPAEAGPETAQQNAADAVPAEAENHQQESGNSCRFEDFLPQESGEEDQDEDEDDFEYDEDDPCGVKVLESLNLSIFPADTAEIVRELIELRKASYAEDMAFRQQYETVNSPP